MPKTDAPIVGYEFGGKDFHGRLAYTVFFAGCNLRCPYCYNRRVATAQHGAWTLEDMLAEVRRRVWRLPDVGIVLSGGEPTAHPQFERALDLFAKYPLGIHTNGLILPQRPNPFESVILSLKAKQAIPSYGERLLAAVRYYGSSKYKELRVVATEALPEANELVYALRTFADFDGWAIKTVPERGKVE